MSTVIDIHKALLAGKKLTIKCATCAEFEVLKLQLQQAHQIPKLLLELTDESIDSYYDAMNERGIFWLGRAKTVTPTHFSISMEPL